MKHINNGISYSGEQKYKCKNCQQRKTKEQMDSEECQNE